MNFRSNDATFVGDKTHRRLVAELQSDNRDLLLRRGVIGLSLLSLAVMIPVTLRQTGVIHRLPALPGDDDDDALMEEEAFELGVPEGPIRISSLASNIMLAATGGRDRAQETPWIPLLAAGKALAAAALSIKYFYKTSRGEERPSPYFAVSSIASLCIAALTIPEAISALRHTPDEVRRRFGRWM